MNTSGNHVAVPTTTAGPAEYAILHVFKKLARYFIVTAIANAVFVLIGWKFNIGFLKHPFPNLVAMNPVTAAGFLFLGSSFFILNAKNNYKVAQSAGLTLIAIPILIGALRLLGAYHAIDFQIDLTIFRDEINADRFGNGPGRMAPSSGACLLLLSICMICLHFGNIGIKAFSNYLALLVFLLALFKSIGYLYHAEQLFFYLVIYDPMSLPTAISLALISLALIFYDPTESYFSIIIRSTTGGVMARLLMPAAIFIPVLFGYIRLTLQWQTPVKVELGVAILVLSIVITFLSFVLLASHLINKKDILQKIAETKFKGMLESAPDAMVIVNSKGIIQIVNAQTEILFGYKRSELLGQKVEILIPQRFGGNHSHHRESFFANPKTRNMGVGLELYGKKNNGSEFLVEISLSPLNTEEGMLVSAAIRDITERRQIDEKMRFLATIADNIQDPVITSDKDSLITRWNLTAERLLEWKSEEVIGKNADQILNVIYSDQSRADIITSYAEKGFWQGEVIYHTKSGKPVNVLVTASKLKGGAGDVVGDLILIRDITERKKNEAALSKFNEELEKRVIERTEAVAKTLNEKNIILESIADAFFAVDKNWIVTYWNRIAEQDLGVTKQQILNENLWKIFSTSIDSFSYKKYHEALNTNQVTHFEDYYDKLDKWYEISAYPAETGLSVFFKDITERKKAAEKIAQSERIYKTIASSIPGSVITLFDAEFRYLLIEGDMLEKAGYEKSILLGNKAQDVLPSERFSYVKAAYERVFKGESFTIETHRKGHDFITHFVPLKNDHDEVYLAMSVGIDVTELKEAHRAITELNVGLEQKIVTRTIELELANKELEAFSYSVAHDLRTPLRAVAGYSTMLAEDYGSQFDEEGQRLLGELQYNNKKMGDLIDDLLTFSRLGRKPISKSLVDMKELIASVLIDIPPHTAKIVTRELHPVVADASLMKNVMMNLLANAAKYSSKTENATIEIFSVSNDDAIIYSVRDNGVGFDMEYASKLFGVFQRLHSDEEFDGTGVGLAIVQRIIHRHGGTVWAEAKVNEGATFSFRMPNTSDINLPE